MRPLPSYALPLAILVAAGGASASLTGLLWEGLYALERPSLAAQAVGQDAVTLCIAVPLLIAASIAAARGSSRARLASAGLQAYFVYTYFQYAALTVFNGLFLLYVLTYSGALILLVTALTAIDLSSLKMFFPPLPFRRPLGIFLTAAGAALGMLWLGLIIPPLIAGTRPALLEDQVSQSLVVQAMDLGLLVPAAVLGGGALLRDRSIGYLLAAIVLTKIVTLGAAIIAMIIVMALRGIDVPLVQVVLFSLLDGLGIYFAAPFFLAMRPNLSGGGSDGKGPLQELGATR